MFFNKLFRKEEKKTDTKNVQEEKDTAIKPRLSQYVTFGRNSHGETAEVILYDPKHNYRKVIVNGSGCFENFPGIVQESWTDYIEGKFDFDAGKIRFRTSFEKYGDGYRCLWEIQPDGRYWADEDGFGMENDSEIILYADLNAKGEFKGPFRIYKIDGERIEESEKKQHKKEYILEEEVKDTLEEIVKDVMKKFLAMVNEKMPDTGSFQPIMFGFRVPKSSNIACVIVEDSSLYQDKRVMKVVVFREGTDKAYNHFYSHLTSEEMKRYIGSEEAKDEVTNSVRVLSESVDEDDWD